MINKNIPMYDRCRPSMVNDKRFEPLNLVIVTRYYCAGDKDYIIYDNDTGRYITEYWSRSNKQAALDDVYDNIIRRWGSPEGLKNILEEK